MEFHLLLMSFICGLFDRYLSVVPLTIVSFIIALSLSILIVFLLTKTAVTRKVLLGHLP